MVMPAMMRSTRCSVLPEDGKSEMLICNLDIEGIARAAAAALAAAAATKAPHVIGHLYPGVKARTCASLSAKFTKRRMWTAPWT